MSLYKGFDQNHFLSIFLNGRWETYVLPIFEHFFENIEILHLESEIYLLN